MSVYCEHRVEAARFATAAFFVLSVGANLDVREPTDLEV